MPHRILLADDSLTIQKVIELTFSGTEFELKAVGNGDLALPLLDSFTPDIVLADCVMPGMSGYELCEEIKKRPDGRFVPVVLLTGTFEPFDKPRAERAGADTFVTKPFDSQGLASIVRDLVRNAAEARAAAPPEPPPTPEPMPAPSTTQAVPTVQPEPEADLYSTTAIPVFRGAEFEMPREEPAAADEPPPDPPTMPISFPLAPPADYEMDLGALDDEPPHRDLDEDIAAFEASGKGTARPDLWDSPAVKAAEAASAPPAEHPPGDLEALAAEASLSELKSLIPHAAESTAATASASAAAAGAAFASAAAGGPLSDDDVDRIARRVLELSGERIVRKIAWDVVPELAERLVKERLDELDRIDS